MSSVVGSACHIACLLFCGTHAEQTSNSGGFSSLLFSSRFYGPKAWLMSAVLSVVPASLLAVAWAGWSLHSLSCGIVEVRGSLAALLDLTLRVPEQIGTKIVIGEGERRAHVCPSVDVVPCANVGVYLALGFCAGLLLAGPIYCCLRSYYASFWTSSAYQQQGDQAEAQPQYQDHRASVSAHSIAWQPPALDAPRSPVAPSVPSVLYSSGTSQRRGSGHTILGRELAQ